MGWIMLFVLPPLARGISNDLSFLHQDTAKTGSRCITIDVKRLGDIWLGQNGCSGQQGLQLLEGGFTIHGPIELGFLRKELCHWLRNLGEVLDKSMVISR